MVCVILYMRTRVALEKKTTHFPVRTIIEFVQKEFCMVKKSGEYVTCKNCGALIWRATYALKARHNHFCNSKCFHEFSKKPTKYEIIENYAAFKVFDRDKNEYTVYIDKEDIYLLNSSYSIVLKDNNTPYVVNGKGQTLHRLIMKTPNSMVVDHINRNPLDNRKENLRICTRGENIQNLKSTNDKSTTKFRNIYLHKKRNKYFVSLVAYKKRYMKGYFPNTPEGLQQAIEVAKELRKKYMPYSVE